MTRWIARGLASAAVAWCAGIGVWLWVAPVPYNGSMSTAYADSNGVVQQATYEVEGTQSFAERSALGPVPLLIPVLLAALGAWAIWRKRLLPAALAVGSLVVFTVLAGFSIGTGYLPAAAALVWAFVARVDS
jgi:hypothetical protein